MTDEPHTIEVVADELALGRAQLDAGQPALAEGTIRRRLARIDAEGSDASADEADALQLLLAESLWRQQRPAAARMALNAIRAGSAQRRLPMAMLIDAETLAAFGEADRASGAQERLLAAVSDDEAFALRMGVPGRLAWPLPGGLRPEPTPEPRPPWSTQAAEPAEPGAEQGSDERLEMAHQRMEEARVAYVDGDRERGDDQMSVAFRLAPSLAADGVAIMEPTLGRQPAAGRLVLYGDLLRAAGREDEAQRAYERAAERRS